MLSLSQEMDLNHYSSQADFAHHLMSSICGEHRLETSCRDKLDFHYEGIRLPHKRLAMGKISYGAHVCINTSNLRAYSISLPVQGKQVLNVRGAEYISNCDKGLVLSNNELQDLVIDKDCIKYQVVIPEHSMQQVLGELLHQPLDYPVLFNPEMNLNVDSSLFVWWKNIDNFLNLRAQFKGVQGMQLWSEDYENFLIKALLLSQENNYSGMLRALCNQYEPEYLRKICEFIRQHAHENICADDLHRIAGVSKTKLYQEFQHYYGTSPLAFLRKYRLQQIYKILNSSSNKKLSISKLAYDWGFNHLGRFSQEYRDEFGETPTETKHKIKWENTNN